MLKGILAGLAAGALWCMVFVAPRKPLGLRWSSLLPGLVLTVAGLLLMMNAVNPRRALSVASEGENFWWGVALACAAMLCWTVFAILNARWLKRHTEVSATEWANWLGIATGIGAVLLWLLAGSDAKTLLALDNFGFLATVCIATGIGSAWAATILWNIASQRLSASLCGQLIVSETLFGLLFSFLWDQALPSASQWFAAVLFTLGILASIKAHR